MVQRRRHELKAITLELGAQPVGDCRKIRTWELAIERQAQVMGISLEAAYNPILRTFQLGGRNGFSQEAIEQALDLVERYCYPIVFRRRGGLVQPIEKSLGAQLAAKVLPGVACFQNLAELTAENSLGVDRVQESIEQAAENFPGVDAELDRQPFMETAEIFPGVKTEVTAIDTGVTFSDRFLACYAPPQSETVFYKANAGGQLSLFDLEVQLVDEPPDPDDFESLDAFRGAIALWDFEHSEPIEQVAKNIPGVKTVDRVQEPERKNQELLIETVKTSPGVKTEAAAIGLAAKNPILTGVTFSDRFLARYAPPQSQIIHFQFDAEFFGVGTVETVLLESMCQWAPCDLLFETVPSMENFCPCGEVLASQCDGRTVVIRVYPDRTVRVPCYKNRVGCCSRLPPGGDVVT
ncbi:MAG: hypothetical protein JGK17_32170 [Microcoleus sp. PH2017_10_PVI_O_A]|uniref:hypothetical protein n=1 Tax=Microcoleus sp. PH2017_10_PVI_O_A TaxID=2798821 RepID=UPI001D662518|nr:hypothetical protein [Microcoleus sp. PH2017_10_PVI_O_A]MCC3410110.1 hypothetical protein [Microcoleus sp. PH2017_10_PVI_O_A]